MRRRRTTGQRKGTAFISSLMITIVDDEPYKGLGLQRAVADPMHLPMVWAS